MKKGTSTILWLALSLFAVQQMAAATPHGTSGGEDPHPNWVIYYTSSDEDVIEPNNKNVFGANYVSNTYTGGQGCITFDGEVTSIGENAFAMRSTFTSITIPEGVTSIGENAFTMCSGLTTLTIPKGVTSIGNQAFDWCNGLTSISVEDGNTEYDSRNDCNALIHTASDNLMYGCSNTTIPEDVTSIGDAAFYDIDGLTTLTIPEGVTSMGTNAFAQCSGLTSILLPKHLTSMGEKAFFACSALTEIYAMMAAPPAIVTNVFYNVDKTTCTLYVPAGSVEDYQAADHWRDFTNIEKAPNTYIYYTSSDGNVTEPNNKYAFGANYVSNTYTDGQGCITFDGEVTSIGENAFTMRSTLTSITIPESVTSIGENAFTMCSGLTTLTIPKKVTNIGYQAFNGCAGLTTISVKTGNINYDSRNNCNAIIETATNTLVQGCKNTTIPESVTSIGDAAFAHCAGLTTLTIPEGVTSIGEVAFNGCSGLTTLTIPEGVTSIGDGAFAMCTGLTTLTIPESVTSIGKSAFQDCISLTKIYAMMAAPPAIVANVFYNVDKTTCTLYVPAGSVEDYQAADHWRDFTNIEKAPNTYIYYTSSDGNVIEPNNKYAFGANYVSNTYTDGQGCITFDGEVTSIGHMAFSECAKLTTLTIPESVTSIGDAAFTSCSGLTTLTIPKGVMSIGGAAFYKCINFTTISVEDGNINYDSRNNCNAIIETSTSTLLQGCKNTTIPEGVTSIGNGAFFNCAGLTTLTIPEGVTSIGEVAFNGCSGLTTLTIPESMTSIGKNAFQGCISFTTLTIPKGVMSIGNGAFNSCAGLTTISVKTGNINYDSRNNCNAIIKTGTNTLVQGCKNTTIPESVTSIGKNAFFGCTGLTALTIPAGMTSIEEAAFFYCTALTEIHAMMVTPPTMGAFVFNYVDKAACTLYVPDGSVAAYRAADRWNEFENIFADIPNRFIYYTSSDGKIEPFASTFGAAIHTNTCTNGKGIIEFEGDVTSIGDEAFKNCTHLSSLTIPASVTTISATAFEGCTGLTTLDLTKVTALPAGTASSLSNPNTLIRTASDLELTRDNVVVGDVCESLVLTDGHPFHNTKAFTATSASYSRTMTTTYGTIFLPFAPDTESYVFLSLTAVDATALTFDEEVAPQANTPYLFRKRSAGAGAVTATNVAIPVSTPQTTTSGNLTMKGTFTKLEFTAADNIYFILNNTFYLFASGDGHKLTINPFRAYFEVEDGSQPAFSIRERNGDTTRIDNRTMEEIPTEIYDLQGRRITKPTSSGIYIVNGKKMFIK